MKYFRMNIAFVLSALSGM